METNSTPVKKCVQPPSSSTDAATTSNTPSRPCLPSMPSSSYTSATPPHAFSVPSAYGSFASPSLQYSSGVSPSYGISSSSSSSLSSQWRANLRPPSSPRRDVIASLSQRIAALFRSGHGGRLIHNALESSSSSSSHKTSSIRLPSYRRSNISSNDEQTEDPSKTVDKYLRRRAVFELLEPDLVVEGMVRNKTDLGLVLQITHVYKIEIRESSMSSSRPIYKESLMSDLQDLYIEGFCPLSELHGSASASSSLHALRNRFALGANIKALVISVDMHSEAIYFSLNNERLQSYQTHHILGVGIEDADHNLHSNVSTIPASPMHHWRTSSWFNHPSKLRKTDYASVSLSSPVTVSSPAIGKGRTFCSRLREHPLFKNPEGQNIMAKAFGIVDHATLFHQHSIDEADKYLSLRSVQNKEWATQSVKRGAELARNSNLEDAVRCYTHAIDVCPQSTDAYVARGAAYVRLDKYENAIQDLKHAVNLEPEHVNARKYLDVAEAAMRAQ